MDIIRRFKCPNCDGEGYVAYLTPGPRPMSSIKNWRFTECYTCDGHKVVLVNEDGWVTGPDAPKRYLCDHGERLADQCGKCNRQSNVPHEIKVKKLGEEIADGAPMRK